MEPQQILGEEMAQPHRISRKVRTTCTKRAPWRTIASSAPAVCVLLFRATASRVLAVHLHVRDPERQWSLSLLQVVAGGGNGNVVPGRILNENTLVLSEDAVVACRNGRPYLMFRSAW